MFVCVYMCVFERIISLSLSLSLNRSQWCLLASLFTFYTTVACKPLPCSNVKNTIFATEARFFYTFIYFCSRYVLIFTYSRRRFKVCVLILRMTFFISIRFGSSFFACKFFFVHFIFCVRVFN